MNQTIPDSIHALRAIQIFNVATMFESLNANFVTSVSVRNVLVGHHLTYEDSLPVELVLISMPCLAVTDLTDASVWNCKRDIIAFRHSIVGVPAVWESIRMGTLCSGHFVLPSYGSHFQRCYGSCAARHSFLLSSVRAATGGRLLVALNKGAAFNTRSDTQEFLTSAPITFFLISIGCVMTVLQNPP